MSTQSARPGGRTRGRHSAAAVVVPELVDFVSGEGFTLRAAGTPPHDLGGGRWWLLGLEEHDCDIALIGLICDDAGDLLGSARVWTPQILADVAGDAATGMVAAFIAADAPHWSSLSNVSAVNGPTPAVASEATPAVMGLPAHWTYAAIPEAAGVNRIRRR